ncbi:MAG: PIN domain-containing protein [Armatimonadetes bacterium]|nr:PIN domain-containing protein [Armatimonadota bacterium]
MSRPERILVDTSVWVEALRPDGEPACREFLRRELERGPSGKATEPRGWSGRLVTCDLVIAELLCGATTRGKDISRLRYALQVVPVLPLPEGAGFLAADLAEALRNKGLGAKPADFVISAIAIAHGAVLAHRDRHFELIAGVAPLETLPIGLQNPGGER